MEVGRIVILDLLVVVLAFHVSGRFLHAGRVPGADCNRLAGGIVGYGRNSLGDISGVLVEVIINDGRREPHDDPFGDGGGKLRGADVNPVVTMAPSRIAIPAIVGKSCSCDRLVANGGAQGTWIHHIPTVIIRV